MIRFLIVVLMFHFSILSYDKTHKIFDNHLKKFVKNGMVNYKDWKNEQQDLEKYLNDLSSVSESEYKNWKDSEKLSFLINAYNAFTIKLILDNYPLSSITDIGTPISKYNLMKGIPWKKDFFILLGKKRYLDWIEHEVLRKDFNEPRIHFAINCASIGCPPLRSEAFVSDKLESQLQDSFLVFMKQKDKNRYDSKSNILYLSKIFEWFQGDFIKNQSLIQFIKPGFNENIPDNANIIFTDYNWNLNELK
jgi:hypothetical protein